MKILSTWDKWRYLFRRGINLFWMKPGTPVQFCWSGEWYRAEIESPVYELHDIVQVPLCRIEEKFSSAYLTLNKTSLLPSKVRKDRTR